MAALSPNRIAWTYTDDAGNDWRVAAQKAVTDQNKLGGEAAAATVPPKPGWIKMRRISVYGATAAKSRTVPVYSSDAPILVPEATVNLNYLAAGGAEDSTSFANNQQSPVWIVGEKHPRKSPVTTQAA